ncbi:tetratricopeptide repeat protein [Erythrobacter donghaensis]|uniref:tetratricopeptide repeat protein n=1 Tax=Erythrobacter donghaensis TaxID=267135 RepID=UPI001302C219|nr:tetratricopeptide repeat protein [Erythrobacter donghaensis]
MDRSIKTGSRIAPRFALVVTTAIAGLAMASISAEAAPRADKSFAEAQSALAKGQVDKAIAYAEEAVAADPRNPGYRALLGAAYLEAGRFQSAATSFNDAMELGDSNPRTVLSFALASIAMGDSRAAVNVLDDNAQAIDQADMGLALALAGQPERGVHVLVNAVRGADEVTPKLRQNLAYAYALAGNWRAARVMAAEDVPADQLEARMASWASMAAPELYQQRIASLLGVRARADGGQPQNLALGNFPAADTMMAAAEAPMDEAPVELAAAPAPAPVAVPAPVRAPTSTFAQAFEAPETSAPMAPVAAPVSTGGIRYVSNPVVQELPASAVSRAPTRVAAAAPSASAKASPKSSQRRMVTAVDMSDKSANTHLIQLGSYDSKVEAERGWTVLRGKFPQLKDHKPVITQAVVNGRTFWRVAADGFGPKSARSMCGAVKSAGRGCFAYAATTPPAGAVKRDVQVASRGR